jgi:hypothetical protein
MHFELRNRMRPDRPIGHAPDEQDFGCAAKRVPQRFGFRAHLS